MDKIFLLKKHKTLLRQALLKWYIFYGYNLTIWKRRK